MKTTLRCLKIITFFACAITQMNFPCCYPNDSKKCIKDRFRCATTSLLEASCCIIDKQLFKPTGSMSGKDYCLAMWFPTNHSSNSTDTIGTICQWTTTGCVFLAGLQTIVSLLPCIKENCYKKIRNNCCCCCPQSYFFCEEFEDDANPDGTPN